MSTLRDAVDTYLTLRRKLGSKLRLPGAYLHRFVDFLEGEGARTHELHGEQGEPVSSG